MGLIKKFRIKDIKNEDAAVELKNISVFYNKRQILDQLNLKINKQEILGMLGPNGVGKSTIFNLITGLKNPNNGEIIIDGFDCINLPINERFTKFKLGFVPQYGGLIHDLTLKDNLKLVSEIHIKEKELREQKIGKLISRFEFETLLNVKAKYLSGGQKKKLVIAMALINDPKILLLDEPFAALDILTIKMLQEIIVNLQTTEEISIVVCDHQARDLLNCVDRAIILSNGKIIASGSPNDVISDKNAKTQYFGDEFNIS
ncbi:sulfate transporter [Pelagibacteraceae bacterium GOM-A4]|nr:sulfate transporter [Pelagibacteraceae bacterium GOM-A4]